MINARDSNKISQYCAKIDDICAACGLSRKDVEYLDKQGKLEQWVLENNIKNIINMAAKIFGKDLQRPGMQSFIARVQSLDNRDKISENITNIYETLLKPLKFTRDLAEIINTTIGFDPILDEIKNKYNLTESQFSKIEHLALLVPPENLKKLIDLAKHSASRVELPRLFNTFYAVVDKGFKFGEPLKNVYVEKSVDNNFNKTDESYVKSHSFAITDDGQLIIGCDYFSEGGVNATNFKSEWDPALYAMKDEHHLNDVELAKIEQLTKLAPVENLKKLLDMCYSKDEKRRLLTTFYEAAETLEATKTVNGLPSKNLYVGKSKESYSFSITNEGQFFIAFGKLAAGMFKKVNNAIDVTNFQEVVKKVARGDENSVLGVIIEEKLHEELYNAGNPFVVKPSKVSVVTETKIKLDPITHQPMPTRFKYVMFEKKMDGDLTRIDTRQIKKIAQYCYDYALGLSFLHSIGYVHCDVKPANALRKGNRAMVSDFGFTRMVGDYFNHGTTLYMPPERWTNAPLNQAVDSFSMGITILDMLCLNLEEIFIKYNAQVLAFMDDFNRNRFFKDLSKDVYGLSPEDAAAKKILIEIAKELTGPKQRLTCAEAAKRIAQNIPGIDISNPT